ncbi:MAG: sulfite exporter TauE/SafE family protein [Ruminococcaceae bacterium]|nr:sulfite exporter TauE/SafE family protein [Oscillospiraceae bacterium]
MIKLFTDKIGQKTVLRLTVFGLLAGVANGVFGAGGGILIVFGLSPLLIHDKEGQRDVFANALCVMFPVSIFSMISYSRAGRFSLDGFSHYLIPCLIGGALGAILLGKLKIPILQKIFAILVIWSGIYMII